MRASFTVIFCFGVATATAMLRAAPIDDLPAPIVTRQPVFSIPFTVPVVDRAAQPAEVRLLVSNNRGATWLAADRVDVRGKPLPYKGGFTFRAPTDGEFWFLIRPADGHGEVAARTGMPELRVVVDTRPPRLDFSATREAGGQVVARWQAVDPTLEPASLRLHYQSTGNPQWQAIAIEPPADRTPGAASGSATWWPADASGLVTIKAEINDAAGNVGVAHAQFELRLQSARSWRNDPQTTRPPTASINRLEAGKDRQDRRADGEAKHRSSSSDAGFAAGTMWPPDATTDLPLGRRPDVGRSSDRLGDPSPETPVRSRAGSMVGPSLVAPGDSLERSLPQRATEPTVHPPVGDQYVATSPNSPAGEPLRMVNSTTFDLDYELESVGRTGIAKVELWVTRDNGRTWNSAGLDHDNLSPFRTTVEGEGIYGYRLTVQSGSGVGGSPPQAGDPPDVTVSVDVTPPTARILSADSGSADRTGELLIRYEAADGQLASRPIALLYSDQPGGSWTTIAAGLANGGTFAWRFDETNPEKVYLRLEARDAAGNVGVFETNEPVALERVLPQGRLRSVRPIDQSARSQSPTSFAAPPVRR